MAGALEAGHPLIASTCHGVLGFMQANKTDGTPWVRGRTMTGVTDAQIHKLGITSQTPLHPETVLRSLGALYQCVHGSSIITGDLSATSTSVPSDLAPTNRCSCDCALLRTHNCSFARASLAPPDRECSDLPLRAGGRQWPGHRHGPEPK